MDVVLWVHSHERWRPRRLLFAESARVLNPGGQILILGFHPLWGRLLRSRIAQAGAEPAFRPTRVGWLVRQLAHRGFTPRALRYGVRWPDLSKGSDWAQTDQPVEIGVPLVYALLAARQPLVRVLPPRLQSAADPSHAPIVLPSRRVA